MTNADGCRFDAALEALEGDDVDEHARPVDGRGRITADCHAASRRASNMDIGEPRRTIFIEPIEEPTNVPAEPVPPSTSPEPSDPRPNREPEFTS
jgi:hypothetical protein